MMYIKAGAANMAGAWFIHRPVWLVRPVRGLYRPKVEDAFESDYQPMRRETKENVTMLAHGKQQK